MTEISGKLKNTSENFRKSQNRLKNNNKSQKTPSAVAASSQWGQFSLNNDQYPRTVTAALEVMKKHKHDDTVNHKHNKDPKKGRNIKNNKVQ